jgi:hypothetical protein
MPQRNEEIRKIIQTEYDKTPSFAVIARTLGLPRKQVARYGYLMGLTSQRISAIQWVSDTHVQCTKCDKIVPYASLRKIRPNGRNPSTVSYCSSCRTNQVSANNTSSIEACLKNRIRSAKARSIQKGLQFDLTIEFLLEMYNKQDGKCFYTDEALLLSDKSSYSKHVISVDKIIPENGYVRGNVVLCTKRANTIKGANTLDDLQLWLPDWYRRIRLYQSGSQSDL